MTKRIFRVILAVVVLALSAKPTSGVNAAEHPIRERAPFVPFTIAALCDFPVYWEALADKGYFTIQTRADNTRYILTGVLKSRFTNLETGKSVERQNSSQYTQIYYNDGSAEFKGSGPGVWLNVPGLPGLAYVRGHVTLTLDAAGNLTSASSSGNIEDLCLSLSD